MKYKKRLLALLLALLILLSVIPCASAKDGVPFDDVDRFCWYYKQVKFCWENGLMYGIDDTRFAPYENLTRGMFIAMLYRLCGSPDVDADTLPFTDVPENIWYIDAVRWAHKTKIVYGTSATEFSPDASITREQIATLLTRFLKKENIDLPKAGKQTKFPDEDKVSEYAVSSVAYIRQRGLMVGDNFGYFNPLSSVSRAEGATLLQSLYWILHPETGTFAPSVTYAAKPAKVTTVVYVDAVKMGYICRIDGRLCVRLDQLLDACGGTLLTHIDGGSRQSCDVTLFGEQFVLKNTADVATRPDGSTFSVGIAPVFDGDYWYLDAETLLARYSFSRFDDTGWNQTFFTKIAYNDKIIAGRKVPVLMYHCVSDTPWSENTDLFVRPSELEKQISLLLSKGYTFITFEDLNDLDKISKPVMMTFDDGYDDNYTNLFPILKKYNVKATVFMIYNDLWKKHKLTVPQLQEMSESGLVSIQSHTMTHGYLSNMNAEQLESETGESKLRLARLTHKEPFVLCYPTGYYSSLSLQYTEKYYEYGLIMSGSPWVTGRNSYTIGRYYVYRGISPYSVLSYCGG